MIKKCIGCGSILQITNKEEKGYTKDIKKDYCMRCFRLKNYGEEKEEQVDEDKILKKVNHSKGIAFFLIDYLNINQETIGIFKQINIPKVLIISKCDILRKEMKYSKITNWLKKIYKIEDDIIYISAKKHFASYNIFKYMDLNQDKTCFIMGITNAGKSTFMNEILKKNNIKKEVVASKKPNTTLEFIKFKIGEYIVYDTPGFSYTNYGESLLDREIKPITYHISKNITFIVNDKFKFYFKEPNDITFYLMNNRIKKVYKRLDDVKIAIDINCNEDFIIPGLGYINIKKKTEFLSNIEVFEKRKNLSGEDYE